MKPRRTSSGIEVRPSYGPADLPPDLPARGGAPGGFPYARGIHETMYRGRLWTMRQYAGFGTAEETNARFRELLAAGQTGLSTAFDLPTQMGYDSDHPLAAGEVGRVGVAVDTVDDLARVFAGIPLDRVTTSMTINATASILLAMYLVVGEEQGVAAGRLGGTIQNDVLKEFIARGTYVFPPERSLRLTTDVFRYVLERDLAFNPISISGYHMREAGATAAQELAFTFADALAYLRHAKGAGLDVGRLAPRISFFFAAHNDLLEEVAKFRAARRMWATLVREEFGGGGDEAACRLRFHTQTAGSTLTAQQPMVNVVRVAVQALAAVLGGTQSLHTNAFDEALALPSADSARLALRTQQVLAFESGVTATADPLGGSYYVEALTAALETGARELMAEVERRGGAVRAIAEGFIQHEIAQAAYAAQRAVEAGQEVVVGVNRFADGAPVEAPSAPDYSALAARQVERLRSARRGRDAARCERALSGLRAAAAAPAAPLMEGIVEAVRARATVGEITAAMESAWGRHGPSLTASSPVG